ncbi:MAG: thiamine pyrophosphate-binding protein [Gemmataceae bacterium]
MSQVHVPSVADRIVERLAQHGVSILFGYPGGQLTPIYDALYRTPGVRHILARHEQAAAFMADGYARATGQPGVCLAVCGPGVYNAATPLATADTDSIPVLLLSGQVPLAGRGRRTGYYHENEQLEASAFFSQTQVCIESPDQVADLVDFAWRQLTERRPGPVLLEVPVDVLREPAPDPLPPLPPPPARPKPDAATLDSLVAALQEARRPILLAGGGVSRSGAEAALRQLAERLGAPVFHTANGKCALPGSHPLAAGMPWTRVTSDLSQMADLFSPLWKVTDFLLAVGCRFTQLATGSWTIPLPARRAQIDIDPGELGRHYPLEIGLVGDARATLEKLLARLPTETRSPWASLPAKKEPWRLPGIDPLGPIARALPANGLVSADVTRLAYMAMAELPLEGARSFLHPAGSVAMGYGLPAGLGARAAFPDRPVLVLVGDGGFQMSAMELATAAQERLPVVVLLVNDSCLTLIKSTQERKYARRFIGVDLHNPDFGQFCRAFGADHQLIASEAHLEEALRSAFAAKHTTVLEVRPSQE